MVLPRSELRRRLTALGPRSRFAIAAFAGQAAFATIAFVGSVASARILGPAGKGTLSAWTVASTLVALVLSGAYPNGFARAYLLGRRETVIPTAAVHAAAVSVICVLGAVVAAVAGADPVGLLLFIVIAAPVSVFTNDLLVLLTAAKRPWIYHLPRIASGALFTVGVLIVFLAGHGDRHVVVWVLFAASAVVAAALYFILCARLIGLSRRTELAEMWRRGRGSWGASVADFLLLRCDQLILVLLVGPTALGVYAVSVNFSEVGQYLGNSIGQALFEDEQTLSSSASRRIFRLTAQAVGGLCVIVGVIAWFTVDPLFGDGFVGARTALLLLLPGIVARGVAWTASQMLFAREAGRDVARVVAITFVIAVPMWVVGALVAGVNGIAAASAAAYGVQMILVVRQFRLHGLRGGQRPDPGYSDPE
jgi:O-antigen/teichoic acid export membrane protein